VTDMTNAGVAFEDATAYELFMGRWSRALGMVFLDWLAPPAHARWLDIGCGTGVFTQLVLDNASPATIAAVDPSQTQIEYARKQALAERIDFHIGDAQELPFPARDFDVVVAALVINLVRDPTRALREMRRVCRFGGTAATFVWDFAAERSMAWPLVHAMKEAGVECPRFPGQDSTSVAALRSFFVHAGFGNVESRSIEVTMTFPSFDEFWRSQAPLFSSHGKIIAAQSEAVRNRIMGAVRTLLPVRPNGSIEVQARANAVKAISL
jgi:ubiquinone/menaquinone biosynthesis C-methylase UbiE